MTLFRVAYSTILPHINAASCYVIIGVMYAVPIQLAWRSEHNYLAMNGSHTVSLFQLKRPRKNVQREQSLLHFHVVAVVWVR
jgi:hypothetical protein